MTCARKDNLILTCRDHENNESTFDRKSYHRYFPVYFYVNSSEKENVFVLT